MDNSEITLMSAAELAARIEAKEVSPVEAAQAYLERIERVDPEVNSYITVCAEVAMEEARRAEGEIQAGGYKGPLHGIPLAVKDQIHTRGIRTTDASKTRADRVPQEDATVVTNLKNAGAVLLGKLNMSEFALGDPVSSAFGPAHNPWDLTRSPGTSSTGSGAATAAHLCATSLGEDTGGSIRGPAANCGLVGLRPSWGRVSRYGVDGACWSVDTIGPISRTVEDCAITIGAIAGYDPKDPYCKNVSVPDYRSAFSGDLKDVKIGLVQEFLDPAQSGLEPKTRQGVLDAADVLRRLGAEVREVSLPMGPLSGMIVRTISHTERVTLHKDSLRNQPQDYHHNTRVSFITGNLIPGQAYYKAQRLRALVRQQVLEVLEDVDVLLQPTNPAPAELLNPEARVGSKEQAIRALSVGSYRGVYSLAGTPALSILCGFTSEGDGGLPLAMQIAGRPFDEEMVLRVAHAYERATPWHKRLPPLLIN